MECVSMLPEEEIKFALGHTLHTRIPPDRWCVTIEDLRFLWDEIRRAVRDGRVTPTDSDAFDLADRTYGPNVYTINEQYIKPITAEAGGPAWALMRHPDGIACDVFVSHAWLEGIFEFLGKVLRSFPRCMRSAWCCMLANPQNINISALISKPSASPFAKALLHAKYVLAVPNDKASIYSRMWCSYEAFLAIEYDKMIIMATESRVQFKCCSYGQLVLASIVSSVFSFAMLESEYRYVVDQIAFHTCSFSALLALSVAHSWFSRVLHFVGISCASFEMVQVMAPSSIFLADVPFQYRAGCWLVAVMFFLTSERDRIELEGALYQSALLHSGYQGIMSCRCYSQTDYDNICGEIADKMDVVDDTIQVLIDAGMSTGGLRETAARGIDVKDAAHCELSNSMAFLGTIAWSSAANFWASNYDPALTIGCRSRAIALLLALVCFLSLAVYLQFDRRAFMFKLANRVAVASLVFCALSNVRYKVQHHWADHQDRFYSEMATFFDFCWIFWSGLVFIIGIAAAGCELTSRVPLVGRPLVRDGLTRSLVSGVVRKLFGESRSVVPTSSPEFANVFMSDSNSEIDGGAWISSESE
eukprot:TRINITY_DN10343_c0_g1_i3.p1 TRINITY_DN10343_c0_g1~~TRINITY_DN10343_c0_g1_i3.p1  ORF type:complete len:587 (-),score=62.49 TRINITY_DN10343_c0_g1_i3:73-1833(-)